MIQTSGESPEWASWFREQTYHAHFLFVEKLLLKIFFLETKGKSKEKELLPVWSALVLSGNMAACMHDFIVNLVNAKLNAKTKPKSNELILMKGKFGTECFHKTNCEYDHTEEPVNLVRYIFF